MQFIYRHGAYDKLAHVYIGIVPKWTCNAFCWRHHIDDWLEAWSLNVDHSECQGFLCFYSGCWWLSTTKRAAAFGPSCHVCGQTRGQRGFPGVCTGYVCFASFPLILFNLSADLDQSQSKFEEPNMLKLPIKAIVASILESGATKRVINALNMPSSASHPDMEIYGCGFICSLLRGLNMLMFAQWRAVSSDNAADASLGPVNANAFVLGNRAHGLRKWLICSSCGTFHTPHYDANSLCTCASVYEGWKLWMWGIREAHTPLPTPWPEAPDAANPSTSWHWALFDNCIVYMVVLGPGDSMYDRLRCCIQNI